MTNDARGTRSGQDGLREDMERSLDRIESELADKTREFDERLEELRTMSDERLAALAARVTFTEAQTPKNANRRKVDEGHHHNQTIEGFDNGALKGFGYQLNATEGITLSRSGRTLTIKADGALGFCYDYLVMDCYIGTEGATHTVAESTCTFKVFSTIQGAIDDAVSTDPNVGLSIAVCKGTYVENVVWPHSGDVGALDFISLIGIGGGYERPGQPTAPQVTIQPSSGDALTYGDQNSLGGNFTNIGFLGPINHTGGINASLVFDRCYFSTAVEINGEIEFNRCFFTGTGIVDDSLAGSVDDLIIRGCYFVNSGIDMSNATLKQQEVLIEGCSFQESDIIIGRAQGINITDNSFQHGGNLDNVIVVTNPATSSGPRAVSITDNLFTSGGGGNITTGEACIVIADTGAEQHQIIITDNQFDAAFTSARDSSTAWIKLIGDSGDKIFGVTVAHNSFGGFTTGSGTIEDEGGFSVIADYLERSALGPNTQVGKVKYKVTNGVNNLIIPASADDNGPSDSGALALDIVPFLFYIPLGNAEDGSPVTP